MLGKIKCSAAWFHYIAIAFKLAYNRNKLFKTWYYWSRDMLNFDILDEGLRIVSPAHFVYDFSTKMFLMLYSINWPNFIAFTSWDIGQYVYCNCLLTRLWRHKFQNQPDLSNQSVFIHDQKVKTPKIVSDLRERL